MSEDSDGPISDNEWRGFIARRYYRVWQAVLLMMERRPIEREHDDAVDREDAAYLEFWRVARRRLVDPANDTLRDDGSLYVVRPLFAKGKAITALDNHYVDLEQFAKFALRMKWPLPFQLTHEFTRGGINLDSKATPWLAGAIASGSDDGAPIRKHDTSDGNKARSLRKLVAMLLLRAYAKRFSDHPRIAIQELADVKSLRKQIALDLKVLGLTMDDKTIVTNLAEVGDENPFDELTELLAEVLSKHSKYIMTGIKKSKLRPE